MENACELVCAHIVVEMHHIKEIPVIEPCILEIIKEPKTIAALKRTNQFIHLSQLPGVNPGII